MEKILYILTKHHTERGGHGDEFAAHWQFAVDLDSVVVSHDNRKIVFIHGSEQAFPEGKINPTEGKFLAKIENWVRAHPTAQQEAVRALLCHARRSQLAVSTILTDFVFAKTYSIDASTGEWAMISQLKGTFDTSANVTNGQAFAEAFDNIWAYFQPDDDLTRELKSAHAAYAEAGNTPLSMSSPKIVAKRKVEIHAYSTYVSDLKKGNEKIIVTNTQTDFYLVIWNDSSYQWFCQQLKAYLVSLHKVTCPAVILLVKSKSEFDTIDWSRNYKTVFVLAEAFATNLSFEGLTLIPSIMKERGNEQPLKIMTCSYFDRKKLGKISKDWDKSLIVNTTQHLTLPTSPSVFIEFSLIEKLVMSRSKWYAQFYELTNDFYKISRIKHNLDNQRSSGENSFDDREIGEELNHLLTFSFLKETGNSVLLLIQKLKTAIESNEPYNLKDKILVSLIHALQRQITALLPNGRSDMDKYAANILIVDDKLTTARQIKAYFLHYFKETDNCKIQIETSGEAALSAIKKNDRQFDAVIADLELLNSDQSEDYVQGSDIIDACQNNHRHIALRVITHLSPSAAAKRLPNFGGNRIVRKSKNSVSEAEDPLWLYDENDFFEKLWLDIDMGRKSKVEQPGPSGGKWGAKSGGSPNLKAHYYDLKATEPDAFKTLTKDVKKMALLFLNNPMPQNVGTELGSPKNNELVKWKRHFARALALRLIFLNTRKDPEGYVEYVNLEDREDEDKGLYFNLGFELNERGEVMLSKKNPFLNELLGFDKTEWKVSENECITRFKIDIYPDSLFPHEKDFEAHYRSTNHTLINKKWNKKLCDGLIVQAENLKAEIKGANYTALGRTIINFLDKPTFTNLETMIINIPIQEGTPPRLIKIRKAMLNEIDSNDDGNLYIPDAIGELIDDM